VTSARVVCIGIATLDAIVVVERLPGSDERVPGLDSTLAGGGVAGSAAVTLARLGIPVTLIGRVGDDRTGDWIRDDLAAEGVDVASVAVLPGRRSPVTAALVERGSGARSLAPHRGTAGPIELTADEIDRCRDAGCLHVDHTAAGVLPVLRAAGVTTPISLDDGLGDPATDLAAVAMYGPTEAALLRRFGSADLDAAAMAALGAGPRTVVVTRGAAGSVAFERRGGTIDRKVVPAFPVAAVSTLGAGDVFHAAVLAGILEGRPLHAAMSRAAACAALACRALDGRSAIPTAAELDAALAGTSAPADG
jgi:sugar/nucleoside kinase (ribokinase family)